LQIQYRSLIAGIIFFALLYFLPCQFFWGLLGIGFCLLIESGQLESRILKSQPFLLYALNTVVQASVIFSMFAAARLLTVGY
jgi:hypothetical protein